MLNRRSIVSNMLLWLMLAAIQSPARVAAQDTAVDRSVEMIGASLPVARLDAHRLGRIAELVEAAIAEGALPGAVVLVGDGRGVVYQEAFGNRAVVPAPEPMTVDTIFDLASLTKVVATTTSVMILVEEGRLRLSDRVAAHLPGFERHGKTDITIGHLLTHVSGLRPDVDLDEPWNGYDTAISLAFDEVPMAAPGERFVYSDINFFLLGEIVSRVGGMSLDRFATARVFEPLGMSDTMFRPPSELESRIAPTERCSEYGWPCAGPQARMLRGTVHDPTARRMHGVAGHAGLFSTAADLATLSRMLLSGGTFEGVRILSPLTVGRMTMASTPPGEPNRRGLGWDLDSVYSANRGELFPPGSFGHTGFTGTSIWIDPTTGVFVVFLSNRLHPDGGGNVTALRARVATVVAAAIRDVDVTDMRRATRAVSAAGVVQPSSAASPVLNGIDVLVAEGFERLRGKRVGLLTNHTGRSRSGATTIDLLHEAASHELVALFSPEHGIRGTLDSDVPSSTDAVTDLPVYSLYGDTRRPAPDQLAELDVVVIDLQDIGARFYTYATTMAYLMEEAARADVEVIVLDRPNPIDGLHVEGPLLDEGTESFTAYFRMPIRHGSTLGELARLFNVEATIGASLSVVPMQGWRRSLWFDATGLPWINPSPNMRSLTQATLYPGIGAIETSNLSVGRGTDKPFEQIGAPWIDGASLAAELNERAIPGIRFYPVTFTPTTSRYAGEDCEGVRMLILDRQALRPVRVGIEVASVLTRMYPAEFEVERASRLLRSAETLKRIRLGEDPQAIARSWAADEAAWRKLRAPYLLYR